MRDRLRRKNLLIKTFLNSKVLTLAGLMIVVLVGYPLLKKMNQQRMINREIAELQAEAARVESKNLELEGLIDYLASDSYAEKEARVNLDMRKPGEKVVIVKGEPAEAEEDAKIDSVFNIPGLDKNKTEKKIEANPSKWLGYFFGSTTN